MNVRPLFVPLLLALLAVPLRPQLRLSGYLSAQYEKGGSESGVSGGTFGAARAGLLLSGQAETIFDYGLEIRFRSESRLELEEAWVGVNPSEAFHLKLGLYLVPFGAFNTANRPQQTIFITPPLALEQAYPASWRDIGVVAEGNLSVLRYAAYVGNGLSEQAFLKDAQQFQDNNRGKSFGGRAGVFLGRNMEIGLSYYRGAYDDAGERNLELRGLDATWDSHAFRLMYEYVDAAIENPPAYSPGSEKGHFGLLALRIGDFSPFVSYQTLEYEDPFHGPGFGVPPDPGEGTSSHLSRWAFGLSYGAAAGLNLKLEYDLNREKGTPLDNNRLIVQTVIQF